MCRGFEPGSEQDVPETKFEDTAGLGDQASRALPERAGPPEEGSGACWEVGQATQGSDL